jgi:DNA repair protein RecN (Recombination protein N)
MLTELRIRDFALIESVALEFAPGLTVLTGETGAGKSIIIDALTAVLGARMTADVIRPKTSAAQVQARFEVAPSGAAGQWLASQGIGGPELVVAREIGGDGRSKAWINGRPATVAMLRELGDRLVEVAGQHEGQQLLQPAVHRELLDASGGARLLAVRRDVAALVEQRAALCEERRVLREAAHDRERTIDHLRHAIGEIDTANPQPGEEDALEVRRTRLAHAERLAASVQAAYAALYDGDGLAAVDRIGQARHALRDVAALDASMRDTLARVESVAAEVAEVARALSGYLQSIEARPDELESVQDRLEVLRALRRKYGPAMQDVLDHRTRAAAQLGELDAHEGRQNELAAALDRAEARLGARCADLSGYRAAAAERLQGEVERVLHALDMKRARFAVSVTPEDDPAGVFVNDRRVAVTPHGADRVEFLFTANPGIGPRPLARIASGGELSRVLLALRHVLAEAGGVPTLVCDEVDAGVGGPTASAIGQVLVNVARARQVLCVTHTAQIAAIAEHHFSIVKDTTSRHTSVSVKAVDPKSRVDEIARLLAGRMPTSIAREHAAELLAVGRRKRTAAVESPSGRGGKS